MRLLATTILLALAIITTQAASLREQLELARTAEDQYAQIELIRRLLDQEPNNIELHDELVALWLKLPDYNMAEAALKAWKDAPEDVKASVMAAVLFYRDDKKAEAVALLEAYLAKNPDDIDITRQLAKYLKSLSENQKIVALLQTAPGVDKAADLLIERSLARREMKDFDGALADFAAAEAVDSTESGVSGNRSAYERLKEALPRIKQADEILAKDPKNLAALIDRSYWYTTTGFASQAAAEDATTVHDLAPDSVGALILYAQAACRAGKLSGRDVLEKLQTDANQPTLSRANLDQLLKQDAVLAKNPRDIPALLARVWALNDSPEQYRLALADTERVLAIDPKNGTARVEKIYALIKIGRQSESLAELKFIEDAKPSPEQLSRALGYFANAAFTSSKLSQALDYADRAIKAKPTVELYKLRAAIFERLARPADAKVDLAKASQLEKKKK